MMNQKGFTLVEIIAVLIILGIMFAAVIPKIISMGQSASDQGINVAIVDLNGREMKAWTSIKLESNYSNDQQVFDSADYQFDSEAYEWISISTIGGTLRFKETTVRIYRRHSAMHEPANWSLQ
ncbi:MAG: type II secretion system protein [Candidatus Heimdallarchaeaceae archaeon]